MPNRILITLQQRRGVTLLMASRSLVAFSEPQDGCGLSNFGRADTTKIACCIHQLSLFYGGSVSLPPLTLPFRPTAARNASRFALSSLAADQDHRVLVPELAFVFQLVGNP